jgi:hypothetical protein
VLLLPAVTINELVRLSMIAFYPKTPELPGLAELGVSEKIATLRRESTVLFWTGIVGASVFFQVSPILTLRRPTFAAFLSEEDLDRHAHAIATYPVYLVRQAVMLLKMIAGIFWGESPEIRTFLHLPAYGEDPKTRRLGSAVVLALPPLRAPVDALVRLGRRELEKGRSPHELHSHGSTRDQGKAEA